MVWVFEGWDAAAARWRRRHPKTSIDAIDARGDFRVILSGLKAH